MVKKDPSDPSKSRSRKMDMSSLVQIPIPLGPCSGSALSSALSRRNGSPQGCTLRRSEGCL